MQAVILIALGGTYGFRYLLGWQYFRAGVAEVEVPPIVVISAASLIAGIITTVVGAVFLVLCLIQWAAPATHFNALLLKNLVFLFGHTIVNITMYFGVAMVYELMPRFSGRPWLTNKAVVIAWNASLFLVLGAFFHHLYMDFAQPRALQYLGQILSYASSAPPTVVTIFGMVSQVYGSGVQWSFVPLTFVLGFMGWLIGGFAAVVDSTIAVNFAFHNTLWVPAHFHTYFLMGYVLLLLGTVYFAVNAAAEKLAKMSLAAMVVGGYGFLTMFYLGGVLAVPRRYATYQAILVHAVQHAGQSTAAIAVALILLYVMGLGLCLLALALRRRLATAETAV
jgi:cytochrome c oxidase subunit 1